MPVPSGEATVRHHASTTNSNVASPYFRCVSPRRRELPATTDRASGCPVPPRGSRIPPETPPTGTEKLPCPTGRRHRGETSATRFRILKLLIPPATAAQTQGPDPPPVPPRFTRLPGPVEKRETGQSSVPNRRYTARKTNHARTPRTTPPNVSGDIVGPGGRNPSIFINFGGPKHPIP